MATSRAIEAACSAIANLLQDTFEPADFGGADFDFSVIDGGDFAGGLPTGAGIFAYRITLNGSLRRPIGQPIVTTGQRELPQLPVDVHLLVAVSAGDPSTTLALTGWVMRKLDDYPVLPAGLLNRSANNQAIFGPNETVEVVFDDVSHEELLHLWEVLGAAKYDVVMLPYVLPNLLIGSTLTVSENREVQERLARYGQLSEARQ